MIEHSSAVVALGGRRIDPEPTLTPRFPFNQVDRVGMQIADQLSRSHAVALVCSAACGADLIALETAPKDGAPHAHHSSVFGCSFSQNFRRGSSAPRVLGSHV